MMRIWLRTATIAMIFMGTVIGAGFASGQEILHFFTRHGPGGLWGVLLSAVLLGGLGSKVMEWGRAYRAESYRILFAQAGGAVVGRLGDGFVTLLLLVLSGVMLAGSGALARELGGMWELGVGITALIGVGVLLFKLSGIRGFNLLVIPLLIATSIAAAGTSFLFPGHSQTITPGGNWLISSLLYAGYNLLLAVPVLVTLHRLEPDGKLLRNGGWLGGVGLGLAALMLHLALTRSAGVGIRSELPLFSLLARWGPWVRGIYAFVLWGELFTTYIANVFGLVQRWGERGKTSYLTRLIVIVAASALIGRMGFAPLIQRVYPVFGVFSLLIIGLFLIRLKPGFPGKPMKSMETTESG